jgi:hypothetical protein
MPETVVRHPVKIYLKSSEIREIFLALSFPLL